MNRTRLVKICQSTEETRAQIAVDDVVGHVCHEEE
jgi:hypothetical protein